MPLVGPLAPLNLIPLQTAPGVDPATDMWRTADYSMIHNLRVNTLEFGASAVTVFLGWAPGLGEYTLDGAEAADGVLSRAEFNALTGDDDTTPVYDGDAIGFLVENLRLGPADDEPGAADRRRRSATLNPLLPRLFALNSRARLRVVGRLRGALRAAGARRSRSRSTRARRGWARCRGRRTRPSTGRRRSRTPTVPATDDAAGYEVRTGTTTAPVLLDFEGTPLIGVSADKVLLQISDAVLVTGSFSFRVGPVRLVDVATGLLSVGPAGRPAGAAQPDPARRRRRSWIRRRTCGGRPTTR